MIGHVYMIRLGFAGETCSATAAAGVLVFSGRLSLQDAVMVLYRDKASQSTNIRAGRCSIVK